MASICLFGDSYIRRLRDFCNGDLKIPGSVRFCCKGGMKAANVPIDLWQDMVRQKPDLVFMCIGGNDLSPISSPSEVFHNIKSLVDKLKAEGTHVYVMELMTRGRFTDSHMDKEKFDRLRKMVNRRLRREYGVDFKVFKTIKFPSDYNADLVHFGSGKKKGQKKFFFGVRNILCAYKK